MSESGSDEIPVTFSDRVNQALFDFAKCIGTAVTDICSYGVTIGEAYVPFDPDPEDECSDEDAQCSQVWVRVAGVQPMNVGAEGWDANCSTDLEIDLEVGVIRCIELKERGEAPTATEVLIASMQAVEDMNAMMCAAMSCVDANGKDVWDAINIGTWVPLGPLGGQYGGIWTFTVEL